MRSWIPRFAKCAKHGPPRERVWGVLFWASFICSVLPRGASVHGRPKPPTPFEELSSSSWEDSRKFPSGSCDSRLVWGPSTARLLRIREAVASLRMTRGGVDQRNPQRDGAVESHASQRKRSTPNPRFASSRAAHRERAERCSAWTAEDGRPHMVQIAATSSHPTASKP
jgi:hypothetical protein